MHIALTRKTWVYALLEYFKICASTKKTKVLQVISVLCSYKAMFCLDSDDPTPSTHTCKDLTFVCLYVSTCAVKH